MPKKSRRVWLTKNVWAISWVSLLQDAASEMLYPIMPIFLNSVLGAPAAIIGAIEGAAEGAAAFTKLISKHINRLMTRKSMVVIGYFLAAVGKLLIALANSWPLVMVGRFVDRIGKGTRSAARDAILVQGVEANQRGRVIGFHRTSDTLGATIGPALALALMALLDNNIRAILFIAVLPAVISTVLTFAIKDNEPQSKKFSIPKTDDLKFSGSLDGKIKSIIWVLAVFSIANFPDALVLLHLSQDGFGISEVIGLYLLFNISYASLSFPAGILADRISPRHVYSIGLVLFAIAYGGIALTSNKYLAMLLVIIYGGFAAVNDVVGKSWVAKLARSDQQLQVQARLQGLSGFGLLLAGIWAGSLWLVGAGMGIVPLLISASVALMTAAVIAVLGR